jgi:hypothetical protein
MNSRHGFASIDVNKRREIYHTAVALLNILVLPSGLQLMHLYLHLPAFRISKIGHRILARKRNGRCDQSRCGQGTHCVLRPTLYQ